MSLPERLKQQNKVYDIRKIGKIINVVDNTKHKIKIFCPKYLKNLGNITKNEIQNILKINCDLYDFTELHSTKKQHINEYFFIIGFSSQNLKISQSFKYFLYQLEQVNNEEKYETVFTKENKELIFYSIITFDYSKLNIKNYPEELKNKVKFLPPLINIKKINKIEKKYDVLFFD